jgi:hypothetical protein
MQATVIKMPVPPAYRSRLPDEATFDDAVQAVVAMHGARWHDFSGAMPEPRFYFDTDHLNRAGLEAFFERWLRDVLVPTNAKDTGWTGPEPR